MKFIQKLVTPIALLAIVTLLTPIAAYAAEESSEQITEPSESEIESSIEYSDDFSTKPCCEVELYDLSVGKDCDMYNFELQEDHVYRLHATFYSSDEAIKDVELYANLPQGDSNTATLIVRNIATGQMRTKLTLVGKAADGSNLKLDYLEGSGLDNNFSRDSYREITSYSFEDLIAPEKGMYIYTLYDSSERQLSRGEYPYGIILDFQAVKPAPSLKSLGDKEGLPLKIGICILLLMLSAPVIFVLSVLFGDKKHRKTRMKTEDSKDTKETDDDKGATETEEVVSEKTDDTIPQQ